MWILAEIRPYQPFINHHHRLIMLHQLVSWVEGWKHLRFMFGILTWRLGECMNDVTMEVRVLAVDSWPKNYPPNPPETNRTSPWK